MAASQTVDPERVKTKRHLIRVGGKLREVLTLKDTTGKVLQRFISPVMLEFYPRDVMQVIIGSTILAIPVAYTEETWNLGQSLPLANVLGISLLSLLFIGAFVYYNYYRNALKEHGDEFLKRVISTYVMSFLVVSIVLTLIQRAPWSTDWLLACKRIILVSFPASMSAAIADMIK